MTVRGMRIPQDTSNMTLPPDQCKILNNRAKDIWIMVYAPNI